MNNNYAKPIVMHGKLILTIVLVCLLFFWMDLQQIYELLCRVHPTLLITAVFLHLLAFFCASLRWWLLLRHIQSLALYRDIAPAYYLGLFSNNFLPTGFGGDVVRTLYLATQGYQMSKLLSSTVMDRVLGLVVLLFTGMITALAQNIFAVDKGNTLILIGFTLVLILSGCLLLSSTFLAWLKTYQSRTHYHRLYGIVINLFETFHSYRQAPKLLLSGVLLSLLLQILVIGVYALLGDSLGLLLPLAAYFIIIPLVMLITNIPISFGGLGLRESSLVTLLMGAGVDYQQGIMLSLLYLSVLWITTLPGGFILLKVHPHHYVKKLPKECPDKHIILSIT
jgi:uncharacterized protein (TIRG00374 family)